MHFSKAYRDLNDEEVKKLAKHIALGLVFTSNHIPEEKSGELVFIPLLFLTEKEVKILEADPPGMLFEYNNLRGPRMINDLPTFASVQFLSVPIANKVIDEVKKFSEEMASKQLDFNAEKRKRKPMRVDSPT